MFFVYDWYSGKWPHFCWLNSSRGGIPEIVVMMNATTGLNTEACSLGHNNNNVSLLTVIVLKLRVPSDERA